MGFFTPILQVPKIFFPASLVGVFSSLNYMEMEEVQPPLLPSLTPLSITSKMLWLLATSNLENGPWGESPAGCSWLRLNWLMGSSGWSTGERIGIADHRSFSHLPFSHLLKPKAPHATNENVSESVFPFNYS